MKTRGSAILAFVALASGALWPEVVVPAMPKKLTTRGIGSGAGISSGGVKIGPEESTNRKKTIHIVYIAVSPVREWQDERGRSVTGSLLAYETGDAKAVKGPFTIVKEGQIRLLKKGGTKPLPFPLDALSERDQDFVRKLDRDNHRVAAERAAKKKAAGER